MRREIQRQERFQQRLRSKGVSEENVHLLHHDPNEPLPTPIRNDLATHEQMKARADGKEKKKRAREAFQSPWLKNTERELNECMVTLKSSITPDTRDSMDALREILEEKPKDHHNNLGTLACQEALAERKKGLRGARTVEKGRPTLRENPLRSPASPELEPERRNGRSIRARKTQNAELLTPRQPGTIWHAVAVHVQLRYWI